VEFTTGCEAGFRLVRRQLAVFHLAGDVAGRGDRRVCALVKIWTFTYLLRWCLSHFQDGGLERLNLLLEVRESPLDLVAQAHRHLSGEFIQLICGEGPHRRGNFSPLRRRRVRRMFEKSRLVGPNPAKAELGRKSRTSLRNQPKAGLRSRANQIVK
jgi:hypothetical protein